MQFWMWTVNEIFSYYLFFPKIFALILPFQTSVHALELNGDASKLPLVIKINTHQLRISEINVWLTRTKNSQRANLLTQNHVKIWIITFQQRLLNVDRVAFVKKVMCWMLPYRNVYCQSIVHAIMAVKATAMAKKSKAIVIHAFVRVEIGFAQIEFAQLHV